MADALLWEATRRDQSELRDMSVEPTTLHGAIIALLAATTLGSFAASYVFWVVRCPAPEGCSAQQVKG